MTDKELSTASLLEIMAAMRDEAAHGRPISIVPTHMEVSPFGEWLMARGVTPELLQELWRKDEYAASLDRWYREFLNGGKTLTFISGVSPAGLSVRDERTVADAVAEFEARPVDPGAAMRAQERADRRHSAAKKLGVKCPKGSCAICWPAAAR